MNEVSLRLAAPRTWEDTVPESTSFHARPQRLFCESGKCRTRMTRVCFLAYRVYGRFAFHSSNLRYWPATSPGHDRFRGQRRSPLFCPPAVALDNCPDANQIIRVTTKQRRSVRGPGHAYARRRLSVLGAHKRLVAQLIHHRLSLKIPYLH